MPSLPSTSPSPHIPPSAMRLISPSALLHAHLTQTPPLRPSSRLPTSCRQITLNTSSLTHANGSSLIRTGATAVVAGVRAELLPVDSIANYRVRSTDNPVSETDDYRDVIANNLLVPNIELSTGCSPKHLPGVPPSVEAQSLSQRLLGLLHTSRVVREEDLKIYYTLPADADPQELAKGPQLKAYWVLYIDVLCISYGGNIFDAAWLAVYAALRDTVLPQAWWDVDLKQVLCSAEIAEGRKLGLRGMPAPLSWVLFVPEVRTGDTGREEMWVLSDPDTFEEECCEEGGCVVVDLDAVGRVEILRLEKNGGGKMGSEGLRDLVGLAGERRKTWENILTSG